jgi:hypothetical protein
MRIFIKLPENFHIQIKDKNYTIKADIKYGSFENDVLLLNTNITAPLLVKNIFLNNIRDFIIKVGLKCLVSYDKIYIDFHSMENIENISYETGGFIIELNN